MNKKIYKYMGVEVLKLALQKDGLCGFKCSFPKDFNDPYELFLTIDFQQSPDLLATYNDTIGEIPQLPTTCFSKSPSVMPMWAHYGHSHQGVVLELDENLFSKKYPEINFGDVTYRENASDELLELLVRACRIGKPRYHFFLQRGVFSAAYFTKHSHWSYEQERRLVADEKQIIDLDGLMLLEFPVDCITSIIAGQKIENKTLTTVQRISETIGARFLRMKTSKTSPVPYFVDSENLCYQFNEGEIEKCKYACKKCGEALPEETSLCAWCAISKHHEKQAAQQNPLRMLQHIGQLDAYYKSMIEIGKNHEE